MNKVIFGSSEHESAWSFVLNQPLESYVAHRLDEVVPLLEAAESAASSNYVAVLLTYESAAAFDHALKTHDPTTFPLAWAGIFKEALTFSDTCTVDSRYELGKWEPKVSLSNYVSAVERIHEYIASGHTYQVNYTFPLRSYFKGDSESWYHSLCAAQGAPYTVYLDLGRFKVLSLSPELFFERNGEQIQAKPMKGTIRRGRWSSEDKELAISLSQSAKERAENVMIVDLIRNDLGKVALPGTVSVPQLYNIEQYRTLWQMTSTVEANLRPRVSLVDLMRALFPCGSVTGAPKISTMKIIRELEPYPRGAYTGAIGILMPGGTSVFNVAIRTLIIDSDNGEVTFGVGGGITIDSTAEQEYDECLLKTSFLSSPVFRLLESILLEDGELFLIARHLKRLQTSADYFGFRFEQEDVIAELEQLRSNNPNGRYKIRLQLSRNGRVNSEALPLPESDSRILRVALAREPVNSTDRFLYHKTTHRSVYEEALAARPDCDDVILWNERGEITESTIANVVLQKEGQLYTPPVNSGLLPGVFREELLVTVKIRERVIYVEELRQMRKFFLINSAQKWREALLVD